METVVDILRTAIDNEIKAQVFYAKASEFTEVGESQMIFLELTDMEKGHSRLILDRFADVFAAAGFDAEAYVAMHEAETREVLTLHENEILSRGEIREALQFAIGLEEKARDGYLDLVERVPEEAKRDVLKQLAAEEQMHHDMLSKALVSMDTPPEERAGL
jgi:rubrerythrin